MEKIIIGSLLVLFAAVVLSLFLALPTMLLWNSVMPDIFGFPVISFWQAMGLCLLSRFLFGTGSSSSSK